MFRPLINYGPILLTCFIAAALFSGCAGAAATAPKKPVVAEPEPFAESSGDLKADLAGDAPTEETTAIPDDIRVPGEEFGMGSAKQAKRKKGKKRGKRKRRKRGGVPYSKNIADQMDDLAWGMHYKKVANLFEKRIRSFHAEQLKNAHGAVEKDEVRAKIRRELNKLKRSYIRFDGKVTGYEGSLVGEEFVHNNSEAMLMWDAGKFVEYLFFFEDRFWKRVRAFKKDLFEEGMTFDKYTKSLIEHFGKGQQAADDRGQLAEMRWQNEDTYMTAFDRSGFFGAYCLVFSAKITQNNLAKLRVHEGLADGSVAEDVSSMITSVTSGDLENQDSSAIDNYTGVAQDGPSAKVDRGDSVLSKQKQLENQQKEQKEEKKGKKDPVDDLF